MVPPLETSRLLVRPFTRDDEEDAHRLFDIELADASTGSSGALSRELRRAWLEWTVLNYEQLSLLYQPPYGERAVTLKDTGEIVGAVGYTPCLAPFGQLPSWGGAGSPALFTPEFGLYWATSPAHRCRGYATEAARALIDYAFEYLRLQRIVATTEHENLASQAVMRRLGMRLETNPLPDPPWFQVVGILENPAILPLLG